MAREHEPRPEDKNILRRATEGIDFSSLDQGASAPEDKRSSNALRKYILEEGLYF